MDASYFDAVNRGDIKTAQMMVDTLEKNPAWEEATEKIAYIKSGINRLSFMSNELAKLDHILD